MILTFLLVKENSKEKKWRLYLKGRLREIEQGKLATENFLPHAGSMDLPPVIV